LGRLETTQPLIFSEEREKNMTNMTRTEQKFSQIQKDPSIIHSLLSEDLDQLRKEYELIQQQNQTVDETNSRTRRETKEDLVHNTNIQHNEQNKEVRHVLGKPLKHLLEKKRVKTTEKDFKKKQVRGIITQPYNDLQDKSDFTSKIFEKLFNNPSDSNFLLLSSTKPNKKHSNVTQEHNLLMKLEAMRYNYLERHNECPTFVIFGTATKPCYTFATDLNNCAEEFVEVTEMFKQSCPQTQFYIYVRQNEAGRIEDDVVKSFTNNGIKVL
jgi:hypothetical protein